jgi:hypothetical protein
LLRTCIGIHKAKLIKWKCTPYLIIRKTWRTKVTHHRKEVYQSNCSGTSFAGGDRRGAAQARRVGWWWPPARCSKGGDQQGPARACWVSRSWWPTRTRTSVREQGASPPRDEDVLACGLCFNFNERTEAPRKVRERKQAQRDEIVTELLGRVILMYISARS